MKAPASANVGEPFDIEVTADDIDLPPIKVRVECRNQQFQTTSQVVDSFAVTTAPAYEPAGAARPPVAGESGVVQPVRCSQPSPPVDLVVRVSVGRTPVGVTLAPGCTVAKTDYAFRMPLECKPAGSSDGGPTDAGWPDSAVDAADIPQADGMSCARSTQCTSMNCVDGVCCNTTCSGFCQACTQAKKGTGMDGTCGRVADMTDPGDEDCPGPGFCHSNAAGACHLPQGAACSGLPGPPYCFGSTCVDRVCCNTLCTLACYSCLGAETGGTDGTCAPVKMGTDPANECLPPAPNCSGVSNTCIP